MLLPGGANGWLYFRYITKVAASLALTGKFGAQRMFSQGASHGSAVLFCEQSVLSEGRESDKGESCDGQAELSGVSRDSLEAWV